MLISSSKTMNIIATRTRRMKLHTRSLVIIITSSLLVLVCQAQALPAESRTSTSGSDTDSASLHQHPFNVRLDDEQPDSTSATTTTTVMNPNGSMEDSSNSASSDSSEHDDDYCQSCFESLLMAKKVLADYYNLNDQYIKIVRQKNGATAAQHAFTKIKSNHNRKRKQSSYLNSTRTIRSNFSALNDTHKPQSIVVSTLRVARAADFGREFNSTQVGSILNHNNYNNNNNSNNNIRRNSSKITRDPALKQISHKRQQLLSESCKTLGEVQQCFNDISRECLGNLHYHSQEVYIKQWYSKLNCQSLSSTGTGRIPFINLRTTLPTLDEPKKVPVPRLVSSPEEVQKRLDALFRSREPQHLGVMLKPNPTKSASQRFQYMRTNSSLESDATSPYKDWYYQLLLPCFLVLMIVAIGLKSLKSPQTM